MAKTAFTCPKCGKEADQVYYKPKIDSRVYVHDVSSRKAKECVVPEKGAKSGGE